MDGFPSGQREQTVNLPAPLSVVRIHPRPPKKRNTSVNRPCFVFLTDMRWTNKIFLQKNLVREPTRSVSSKGRARPRPLSTLRDYIDLQVIANYANQCHVLYYHTARNIILIIEKHAKTILLSVFFGLPERARTADLGSRSPVCYPTAPQVVKVRSSHR